MQPISNPLVIYHASCTDGFGAAWAVREFLKGKPVGKIDYFAAHYNRPPPDVRGRTVIIVDFSYPKDEMIKIAMMAANVLWIDHHKTAIDVYKADPEAYSLIETHLDLNMSGAGLAWEYFHDRPMPELISRIQDRDLWKFNYPDTKFVIEAVASYDMSFEIWDWLMEAPLELLRKEGEVLCRKSEKTIKSTMNQNPIMMKIGGRIVGVYNLTHNISETLNRIVTEVEETPFAASFFVSPEGYIFSLRSIDSKDDVAEIAKEYGGGGHRNASGFKVQDISKMLL